MASTNKTTNYELSQYVGTDKPTYLGDYNSDMSKIDNAIHGVSQSVGTEQGRINLLETDRGTMANLQTTDKSSLVGAINEVDDNSKTNKTNIGSLSNLTTSNKTSIVNAINEVDANVKAQPDMILSYITTYDVSQYKTSGGNVSGSVTIARNNDGSVAKIYGRFGETAPNGQEIVITIPNTGLAPDENIVIADTGIGTPTNGNVWHYARYPKYEIDTNGTLRIRCYEEPNNANLSIWLTNSIYFMKNFGDTPQP